MSTLEKGSIVEAVKAAHYRGGDGSAWRIYAPHSLSWYEYAEYDAARWDARIMNDEQACDVAMYLSTVGGEG